MNYLDLVSFDTVIAESSRKMRHFKEKRYGNYIGDVMRLPYGTLARVSTEEGRIYLVRKSDLTKEPSYFYKIYFAKIIDEAKNEEIYHYELNGYKSCLAKFNEIINDNVENRDEVLEYGNERFYSDSKQMIYIIKQMFD